MDLKISYKCLIVLKNNFAVAEFSFSKTKKNFKTKKKKKKWNTWMHHWLLSDLELWERDGCFLRLNSTMVGIKSTISEREQRTPTIFSFLDDFTVPTSIIMINVWRSKRKLDPFTGWMTLLHYHSHNPSKFLNF